MTYIRLLLATALLVFSSASSSAEENPLSLSLKGYLGKEELAPIKEKITSTQSSLYLIELSSTSADLNELLTLVKLLYEKKVQEGVRLVVYIDDEAIGPAAIIPFLADELYISYFVSWGDIPLGTHEALPTNILRNRVMSLISSQNPNAPLLRLMASAMADPSVQVVDKEGWQIIRQETDEEVDLVSAKGETLVVNQNQLQRLGLVSGLVSEKGFRQKFRKEQALEPEKQVVEAIAAGGIDKEFKDHIHYAAEEKNTVGRIVIDDRTTGITQATWVYVKNALDYYKETKPAFVILELNTPGGEVFASQRISDALKDLDTHYDIPVVAFINNWAISAGAMLAYSCRFITVVKDGSMGAAEPVQMGEGGKMQSAPEKINSALRADFANRARFFDRNPNIAEAMVDKDMILVQRHGKIIKLDDEDQIHKTGPDQDEVISAKGKLLTLNANEQIEYGVADLLLLPEKLEPITAKEESKGQWPASKMLLFAYPFFKNIPNAVIDTYQMDWKTQFFVLLAHPMVASMLFLGMMLGFYTEINTPGFGVPGTIGLTCLTMIVLSSFSLDIASTLEIILVVVGLIMLGIEIFLIPSFGLMGIMGIIFFLAGLLGMMLPGIGSVDFELDTQTFNAAGEAFLHRLAWLAGTFVVGVGIIVLIARKISPNLSGLSRFVLVGREQDKEKGFVAGEDVSKLPPVGSKGSVAATLRPAGKIIIDDEYFDAITSGDFIEKGTPIVVAELQGSFIVVERDKDKEKPA